MPQPVIPNGLYRHYKGKMYRLFGVVRHSETLEELVHYEALEPSDLGQFWVRPKEMFLGDIVIDGKSQPRFEYVNDETL